jgi:hypothetical protein
MNEVKCMSGEFGFLRTIVSVLEFREEITNPDLSVWSGSASVSTTYGVLQ